MAERLALAVIPGVGWRAEETAAIAREAEAAGFDAIFAAEVNNDVMATAQLMGAATSRIGERLEDVVKRADLRMLRAKRAHYADVENKRRLADDAAREARKAG